MLNQESRSERRAVIVADKLQPKTKRNTTSPPACEDTLV